jgi:hypothetical protein
MTAACARWEFLLSKAPDEHTEVSSSHSSESRISRDRYPSIACTDVLQPAT